jgi:immunoglobulin-binding protein 1
MLENQAIKTIDSLSTLNQEIEIVSHMITLMAQNGGKLPTPQPPQPRGPPSQPIVITDPKQFVKDNVFKPSWNLPTVSIEQAAEIDYQEMLQRESRQKAAEKKKAQKAVKEFGDDDDEAEELKKTREFDNFKDENPRGSGNTGTKGYKY